MKRKPWPIIVLAVAQLVAFAFNFWLGSKLSQLSLGQYLKEFIAQDGVSNFYFQFAAQTICAIAIFSVKKWSFPVFMTVQSINMYQLYLTYNQFPNRFQLPLAAFYFACTIVFVSYFLLPAVRAVYFNPRLRWWESKPRFKVMLDAKIQSAKNKKIKCTISEISSEGVYISSRTKLLLGQPVKISFSFLETSIENLNGIVAYATLHGREGYAIKCTDHEHKKILARITKALIKGELELPENSAKDDFKKWMSKVKVGQGILPDVPPTISKKSMAKVLDVPADRLKFKNRPAA
jgi:hypothetical protein